MVFRGSTEGTKGLTRSGLGPFWTNLGHLSGPLCPSASPGVIPTPPHPIAPCAQEPALLHEQPWAQDHQLLWCQPLARSGEMHFKQPHAIKPHSHCRQKQTTRHVPNYLSSNSVSSVPLPSVPSWPEALQGILSAHFLKTEFNSEKHSWSAPGMA